jgi:hypothetical protein
MRKTFVYSLVLVMAAALFAACATTVVTAAWRDGSYQGKPSKVLVYAMLKNQTNRRIAEDEFVKYYTFRGIDAVPSYTVFPGDGLVKKEVLDEKLKTQGFDTLLLTQLTGTRIEQVQVPGTITTYQPMYPPGYQPPPYVHTWPGYYNRYYNSGYTAVYSPSYTAEEEYVMAEANLYDVATEKLIWTAATETKIGKKVEKTIKAYVAVIMEEMRKQMLVP